MGIRWVNHTVSGGWLGMGIGRVFRLSQPGLEWWLWKPVHDSRWAGGV